MRIFAVKAHWDSDAGVWWAESDDVRGLVAEAETHDRLVADLRSIIPELLAMNMPEIDLSSVKFSLVSDQIEELCAA